MSRSKKLKKRKDNIVFLNEKDALWQYILDHSYPCDHGGYIARIWVKSRGQFETSVLARQKGFYKNTEEDLQKKAVRRLHKNYTDKNVTPSMLRRFFLWLASKV